MNLGRFKVAAKSLILVCFGLFVVLPVLAACAWGVQDWRYTYFCWRGQQYYAQVADACDQLLNQNEPLPRQLKGEKLQSLPAVLKDLCPAYANVETNIVLLRVGPHLILWKSGGGSYWDLITANPEVRTSKVRFSREKPPSANKRASLDAASTICLYSGGHFRRASEPER